MQIEWGKIERFNEPGKPFAIIEMSISKIDDSLSMMRKPVEVICDGQAFGFIELGGQDIGNRTYRVVLRSDFPETYLNSLTKGTLNVYRGLEVSSGDSERDRVRRIRRGIPLEDPTLIAA